MFFFFFVALGHAAVRDFNGEKVKNLSHLADMVANCKEKFISFTLHYHTKITLNREECAESEELILKQHSIDAPARLDNVRATFKPQRDDAASPPDADDGDAVNGDKMVDVDDAGGEDAPASSSVGANLDTNTKIDPSSCAL